MEDEALKTEVFTALDKVVESPDAILASNTSSIPIMKLGMATHRPEHVIGIHFFTRCPCCVSLSSSARCSHRPRRSAAGIRRERSPEARHQESGSRRFHRQRAADPVHPVGHQDDGIGFASADDIDTGMVEGCNHPMGPFASPISSGSTPPWRRGQPLRGVQRALYASPPLLSRMVEAGLLGRKVAAASTTTAVPDDDLPRARGQIGLDGHDRGVKVVAGCFGTRLRGDLHGLFQTPEKVAGAAADEDVDRRGVVDAVRCAYDARTRVVAKVPRGRPRHPRRVGGIIPGPTSRSSSRLGWRRCSRRVRPLAKSCAPYGKPLRLPRPARSSWPRSIPSNG